MRAQFGQNNAVLLRSDRIVPQHLIRLVEQKTTLLYRCMNLLRRIIGIITATLFVNDALDFRTDIRRTWHLPKHSVGLTWDSHGGEAANQHRSPSMHRVPPLFDRDLHRFAATNQSSDGFYHEVLAGKKTIGQPINKKTQIDITAPLDLPPEFSPVTSLGC